MQSQCPRVARARSRFADARRVRADSTARGYEQSFLIKFGNGGGWDSQGVVELVADGKVVWTKTKPKVVRHTGWFYRANVAVHFIAGTVRMKNENECYNIWDCPN